MNPRIDRQSRKGTVLVLGFYDRGPDGFAIRAESSTQAESGLHELSRKSLLDLLATGSSREPAKSAQELGLGLYKRIFSGELAELLRDTRAAARARDESLRIVLSFDADSPLLELPWELLHDGGDFLALDHATPIARALRSRREGYALKVSPPLRILFTTASSIPVGIDPKFHPLQFDHEEEAIRDAERDSNGLLRVDVARGSIERPMTRLRLQNLFQTARRRDAPYHLWHHSGHGALLEHDGQKEFHLLLDRGDGEQEPLSPELIRRWINGPRDLRVALLNLCHGASEIGLGKRLAELDVPAVIGMRTGVLDPAAAAFSRGFYGALPTLPLDVALTYGRLGMLDAEWPLEWAQPILFCKARDPLILLEPVIEAPPELSRMLGGPRFKVGRIKARQVTQVAMSDDAAPDRPSAFDIDTLEADELLEIDGLKLSREADTLRTELDALRQHLTAMSNR